MRVGKLIVILLIISWIFGCGSGSTSEKLPVMSIEDSNSVEILNTSGIYDFGDVDKTFDKTEVFTIKNSGEGNLKLTGTSIIDITGADASSFTVIHSPASEILPQDHTTFEIKFTATAVKTFSATVSVVNNDENTNPYKFTLSGVGKALEPEINVKQGVIDIPSITGSFDFGNAFVGKSSLLITFTIENTGLADLLLTGTPKIVLSGSDAAMFTLDQNAIISPIVPAGTTQFTVLFKPTSLGVKSATVSILNNDSDESNCTFSLTGEGNEYNKGDFNGDGLLDIIIGASADDDGGQNSGCAFIFFGRSSWNTDYDATDADVTIIGNTDKSNLGYSVSSAGDINGDEYEDIIIGSVGNDSGAGQYSGSTYIFFGRGQWSKSIKAFDADVQINGEHAWDQLGYSVSSLGDINNDTIDDIIIGAPDYKDSNNLSLGCAFIFFGRNQWNADYMSSSADVIITGDDEYDKFGCSVVSAGDINNDGKLDILIGAYWAENGTSNNGCAYIFFGRSNWNPAMSAADNDVKFSGDGFESNFGLSISCAGDINDDSIQDIVIGACKEDYLTNETGCVYVYFGRNQWLSSYSSLDADVRFTTDFNFDWLGSSVSSAGDVNKDGIDDLLIGMRGYNKPYKTNSGVSLIFYGKANWNNSILANTADVLIYGESNYGYLSTDMCSAGDFNKDGFDDFIISDDKGYVYLYYGKSNLNKNLSTSNAEITFKGDNSDDNFGKSVSCN